MGQQVDIDELVDTSAIADILGLSRRNAVAVYVARYDDFPTPIIERGRCRLRPACRHRGVGQGDRACLIATLAGAALEAGGAGRGSTMRRVVIVTLAAVMLASCGGGGSSKSAVASDSAPTTKATTTSTSTTTDAKAGCLAAMRKVPSPPKAPDLAPTLEVCRTIGEWVNAGKKAHIYFGYGPSRP